MQVFALKHTSTGQFMPMRMFRTGGWSYWNPGFVHPEYGEDKPHDPNPRIFYSKQSALNARTAWTQGQWERHRGTTYSFDGPEGYDETVPKEPPAPRKLTDLEIVPLELAGL